MNQSSRKKTRRYLMQCLYARIYGELDIQKMKHSYYDGILDFNIDTIYFDEMISLVVKKEKEILSIIIELAPKFDIETMLKTNILALAIAISEMLWFSEEIPAKVSINEAIELVKYYGDDTSKNIVNGVLNSFLEKIGNYQKEIIIPEELPKLFC